jgi:hypothetical protein
MHVDMKTCLGRQWAFTTMFHGKSVRQWDEMKLTRVYA